jgi:hypothetical protein
MSMVKFSLDGNWEVESTGSNHLSVTNPAAPYSVEMNTKGEYPYVTIVEKFGEEFHCSCRCFAVIRNNHGVWEVFVTDNPRVGNNYATPLTEGARRSESNTHPFISTDGLPVTILGEALTNSARIQGKVITGVCEVQNGASISTSPYAQNPRWISFFEFSKTSTDMTVKSVLFDFLMQIAKISGQNVGPSGEN